MTSKNQNDLESRLAKLEEENRQLKEQYAALAAKNSNGGSDEKKNNDTDPCLWDTSLLEKFDTFIFDCDGVVWQASKPVDGAKESLQHLLSKLNKKLIFLSNNSTKTIETYQEKFKKLFGLDISKEHIFTSAIATASYLTTLANNNDGNKNDFTFDIKKDKVLLIGAIGIYSIIKDYGFNVIWTQNDKDFPGLRNMKPNEIADLKLDESVKIVVAGMDISFTYNDTSIACRYLNELNTKFVGSNDDTTFPAKPGIVLAGTGSLLKCIEATLPANKKMTVCGKPHKLLFDLIVNKHSNIDAKKTIMIGDRLNTDIVFGKNCNLKTLLVLTGVTSKEALAESSIKPDYYLPSIKTLV